MMPAMERARLVGDLELYPDACLIATPGMEILGLNRRAAELFRLADRSGMARTKMEDLFPDGSQAALLHWLARGATGELTTLLRTGTDATHCWASVTAAQLTLDGQTCHLIALRSNSGPDLSGSDDIDEYRRLREAAASRRVGIFEHDHVNETIYGNGEVRVQYGLQPTEPLSIEVFAGATHPDDRNYLVGQIARAHDPSGDGGFDVRHRIIQKNGEIRWIHTCAQTRFELTDGDQRRPLLTTGSVIDVTEPHLREEDNQRLAAILEATVDLVAMTDLQGRLIYLNPAGRALVGLEPGAELASLCAEELFWGGERDGLEDAVEIALLSGGFQAEAQLRTANGQLVPVSIVLLAHKPTRSIGAYLSIIARDLTKQRNLEAQLHHAQKLEAIGRLAGGVAHDFNNLLSVIFGFTTLALGDETIPAEVRDGLEETLSAAERAATLTGQLLSFSRKQVLSPVVLDVGQVLGEMRPMLRHLLKEHVTLSMALTERNVRIRVDRTQFEQVVMNLVVNARDAVEENGAIGIETDLVGSPAGVGLGPGRYLVLTVSDNGEGIPAEVIDRIFEPFFTTKAQGRGTGLGLSTAFGIVKQSGGEICVFSERGHGTTFKVYLPSCEEPATLTEERMPLSRPSGTAGVILIVEDEPQLRKVLLAVLAKAGHNAIAASGPVEALAVARERRGDISLVVTDVVMPQMNGFKLSARLLEDGLDVPILYMSGYAEETLAGRPLLTPDVNFLPKPIEPSRLIRAVSGLLRRRKNLTHPRPG